MKLEFLFTQNYKVTISNKQYRVFLFTQNYKVLNLSKQYRVF